MPRLINSTPKYRKHRASGQAIATIAGRDIYLGPHGTKTSHSPYNRIIAQWLANRRRMPVHGEDHAGLVVAHVMAAHLRHAKIYSRGQPSGYHEMYRINDAIRPHSP
ncbi:MAG: hypothetical protein FJ276_06765 [Planctomycetes bacterium]|nr:hypothetical protein [Planctomycetota bacterium]